MTINVFGGGSSGGPAFPLQRSVRLRSSAPAGFTKTYASAGNRLKWTWSAWVKRGTLGVAQTLVSGTVVAASSEEMVQFSSDTLQFYDGSVGALTVTNAVFRDPSAWYHIMFVYDSANATQANRGIFYVNGVQQTNSTNVIGSSRSSYINSTNTQGIGRFATISGSTFDGYLTEVNFIDGQALTPASFGSINSTTGVWQPIKYSGTYGTNGYYLNFQDNSNNTAATIGKDSSGNGNNWTPNGISVTAGVTYDSMLDVPTLTSATNANFCVMNPLNLPRGGTLSNGNLLWTSPSAEAQAVGTMYVSSGKWYWEMIENVVGGCAFGITKDTTNINSATLTTGSYSYYTNGNKYDGNTGTAYGATFTNGDLIGVALDLDAGTLTFYKNNTSQGTAFTGLSGNFAPFIFDGTGAATPTFDANFGQRPFTYTPPSGFKSLNTYNLPAPTIPNANKNFGINLWTGNGTSQTIVNSGSFAPDLVWIKDRTSGTNNPRLLDTIRGATKEIYSSLTNSEQTDTGSITAFNSNGFSIGSSVGVNAITNAVVGWQWKAGGTAVTNTSGSITSSVSANPSAGFSIVTYTGTGANATVGHGLGIAPKMVIVKNRTAGGAGYWLTWHSNMTSASYYLALNLTIAQTLDATVWNSTAPTSSVFSIGTNTTSNNSGTNFVAYCFSEIAGYSKFGSYTGNGSADGTFVYTGFRPRFILLKNSSSAADWVTFDTSRDTYNLATKYLVPNTSGAEATGASVQLDILSNGFKIRGTWVGMNASGSTIIYAAFCESPFNYSLAR